MAAVAQELIGKSPEKLSAEQLRMALAILRQAPEIATEGPMEAGSGESPRREVNGRKKPSGRRALPKSLPRRRVVVDLPEEKKQCGCGERLARATLPDDEVVALYCQRMRIEQGFRDFKTHLGLRGLRLQVRISQHVQRLLLAFTLAYALVVALGTSQLAEEARERLEDSRPTTRHDTAPLGSFPLAASPPCSSADCAHTS